MAFPSRLVTLRLDSEIDQDSDALALILSSFLKGSPVALHPADRARVADRCQAAERAMAWAGWWCQRSSSGGTSTARWA